MLLIAVAVYAFCGRAGSACLTARKNGLYLQVSSDWLFYQGQKEADSAHSFAGLLMTAIGVYFTFKEDYFSRADDFAVIVLIFGAALLVKSFKTKEYQYESLLMIAVALYLYFFRQIAAWLKSVNIETAYVEAYWPAAFIAVSLLLLFLKENSLFKKSTCINPASAFSLSRDHLLDRRPCFLFTLFRFGGKQYEPVFFFYIKRLFDDFGMLFPFAFRDFIRFCRNHDHRNFIML